MYNILNKNKLRLTARRFTLVIFIILTALLQNSFSGIFSDSNYGIFLLIPLTVSIAMFEKEFAGMFFGILAGAIWDLSSPATDGVIAFTLGVTACIVGLLTHYIFRNTLKTAAVFTFAAIFLFCTVSLVFNCLVKDFYGVQYYFREFCLPSAALTFVLFPFSYYPVKFAEKLLRDESSKVKIYDN